MYPQNKEDGDSQRIAGKERNAFREINNAMWDEALEGRVIRDGSKGYLLKI